MHTLLVLKIKQIVLKLPLDNTKQKQTPWPESASEQYRPRDRRLLENLVPTFADRGCHVVSVTDSYGRILGFLDR
jgi:CBS-domain-containing membrane protein